MRSSTGRARSPPERSGTATVTGPTPNSARSTGGPDWVICPTRPFDSPNSPATAA